MFSERLENLIKAALQDGVLSEQEKASIIKRAQAEGEDIDEVSIYIQSLIQKRQQELEQKNKEAYAVKSKEIRENEEERSKTIRKCPKCGSLIPNLTSICPECGFIIEKSTIDKKVTYLASLIRSCIDALEYSSDWGIQTNGSVTFLNIKKEQYDEMPNCFIINEESDLGPDYIKVDYNLSGIITESQLYSDNDTISSLLKELHDKEKKLIVQDIQWSIDNIKNRIFNPNHEHYANEQKYKKNIWDIIQDCKLLKEEYLDVPVEEINNFEEELASIQNTYQELFPNLNNQRERKVETKKQKAENFIKLFSNKLLEFIKKLLDEFNIT